MNETRAVESATVMLLPLLLSALAVGFACSSSPMNVCARNSDASSDSGEPGGSDGSSGSDGMSLDDGSSGSDIWSVDRPPLCDGVEHLRLWLLTDPGRETAGSYVRVENGTQFFTVDGTCRYWIRGEWTEGMFLSRDQPVRTGTLTEMEAKTLEQNVPLDETTLLPDCPPVAGLFDASTRRIRTPTGMASCYGQGIGSRFDAVWMVVATVAATAWERGVPMPNDGSLHVSATETGDFPSTPPAYAWPVALPLSLLVPAPGDLYSLGVSRKIDDPDVAKKVRALRDQYLADRTAQPGLYAHWDGLKATDQSIHAFVYMRDAIPYEDARGLLRF